MSRWLRPSRPRAGPPVLVVELDVLQGAAMPQLYFPRPPENLISKRPYPARGVHDHRLAAEQVPQASERRIANVRQPRVVKRRPRVRVIGQIAHVDVCRRLDEVKKDVFRVVGELAREADHDDAAALLGDERRDPSEQRPSKERLEKPAPQEPERLTDAASLVPDPRCAERKIALVQPLGEDGLHEALGCPTVLHVAEASVKLVVACSPLCLDFRQCLQVFDHFVR